MKSKIRYWISALLVGLLILFIALLVKDSKAYGAQADTNYLQVQSEADLEKAIEDCLLGQGDVDFEKAIENCFRSRDNAGIESHPQIREKIIDEMVFDKILLFLFEVSVLFLFGIIIFFLFGFLVFRLFKFVMKKWHSRLPG